MRNWSSKFDHSTVRYGDKFGEIGVAVCDTALSPNLSPNPNRTQVWYD